MCAVECTNFCHTICHWTLASGQNAGQLCNHRAWHSSVQNAMLLLCVIDQSALCRMALERISSVCTAMQCDTMSHRVTWSHAVRHHVMQGHAVHHVTQDSCNTTPCHAGSCSAIPCHTGPCVTMSRSVQWIIFWLLGRLHEASQQRRPALHPVFGCSG